MKRASAWIMVIGLCFFVGTFAAGCSDETPSGGEICDNNADDDNDGKTDCADPDCANNAACAQGDGGGTADTGGGGDLGTPDQSTGSDASTVAAIQQDVVNTIALPASGTDYALDLDGTGKKNALGGIVAALKTAGFDLQPQLDDALKTGVLLLLLEVFADSITDAAKATLQAHLGADLDSDPSNNFSGSANFGISSNSPTDAKLDGKITGGKVEAGPGKIIVPLPLGTTPTLVTLTKARVEATIAANGMTAGIIGGAIPQSDIDGKLLPGVALLADAALKNPQIPQATRDIISNLLDTNKDGTITTAEIKGNILLAAVLKPDIDTDGDNTPDALSIGLGFTAVTCTINKGN